MSEASEETSWLLRGKAEGIAEEWAPVCNLVVNPAFPLDHEFEAEASIEDRALKTGMAVTLGIWPVLTILLHAAPFTQPTQPGDITGFTFWFVCAMFTLLPAFLVVLPIAGTVASLRQRKAQQGKPARYYALPTESARWVKLFQRESKAVLDLDPEPDLYFLLQDAREQVRLWQLKLIEAVKEERVSDQASLENALRNAAVDMTHLRLSLEKQRADTRAVYEEALLDTPVNIGAQARALERGEALVSEPVFTQTIADLV